MEGTINMPKEVIEPVKLYSNLKPLTCAHCGKDLLEEPNLSIIVFVEDRNSGNYTDIYTCCKRECDRALEKARVGKNQSDGWKDITEFMNPVLFLKHWMAVMNNIYDGIKFTKVAYENYKDIILATAPYVMREQTEAEKERVAIDSMIPF
jgi:hypothetical protein